MRALLAALTSNPWSKLLSVVLAVFAWLYVQGEEIREDQLKVQVAWTLPEELVSTEPLPVTALLVVRGSRNAINRAHATPIRLVVDAAGLEKGEHTIELGSVVPEGLPPTVERLGVSPSSVRFDLDTLATHNVQITPVLVGSPSPGFRVASVAIEPAVVMLQGPNEAISSLREVPTRPIDVSAVAEETVREVQLDLPRGVTLAKDLPIRATLEIASQSEQRRIEEVPVYSWGNERLLIEPARVAVVLEGPVSELRSLHADKVVAFVRLDAPLETDEPIEVWHGPRDGPRVELLHPGDDIVVVEMSPPQVRVSRLK